MRKLAVTLLLLLTLSTTCADDEQDIPPEGPPPEPIQVVAPSQELQPFNKVMYVLDVSYSMKDELEIAIRAIDVFCSDGFQAAAVVFSSDFERWAGVHEPCTHPTTEPCGSHCLPSGWCWMPKHRNNLLKYLKSFGAIGSTKPAGAIKYALENAPAGCLIVFISDGIFKKEEELVFETAKTGMAWRDEHKMEPVQILVWAVSDVAAVNHSMIELARIGGGGLWRPNVNRSGPH